MYSGTSNKRSSDIGTTSQPHANTLVYCLTSEIGKTSLLGTQSLAPIVSLVRTFHCTDNAYTHSVSLVSLSVGEGRSGARVGP